MSAQADPKLLKEETDVHHKAIGSISDPYGMASTADWDGVNATLDRTFESVPESTVMDVCSSISSITGSGAPAYLESLVKGAAAERPTRAS